MRMPITNCVINLNKKIMFKYCILTLQNGMKKIVKVSDDSTKQSVYKYFIGLQMRVNLFNGCVDLSEVIHTELIENVTE